MTERELADQMAAAAKAATDQCIARGLDRHDPVTVASAKRAAEEVYTASGRAYEPSVPRVVDQPRRGDLPASTTWAPPARIVADLREREDEWSHRADLD